VSSLASLEALLRIGPYRRFLVASTLVSIGVWTLQVGLAWTLLDGSGSALVVGLLQTAMSIAIPLVTIPAGILADRLGPRDLIVVCYAALVACLATLSGLAAIGQLSVPAALLIAVVFGLFDGLAVTPTHVLVGRLVPRERMATAISFSSIAFGIGRIVGGPLGGLLLVVGGAALALGVAALGILVASLLLLSVPRPLALAGGQRPRLRDIGEAWRWARTSRATLTVFALGAVAALCLWPYVALLPLVVRDLVAGGADELGLLVAAAGIGAIVAAFIADPLGRALGRGRLLVGSLVAGGALLVALAVTRDIATALPVAALLSTAVVVWTATTNVLLQVLAPPAMRGRVLALHGVIFFTSIPIGMVAGGIVAELVGVTAALVLLGIATCAATAVTLLIDASLVGGTRLGMDLEPERVAVATAVLDGPSGQPQPLAGDLASELDPRAPPDGAPQTRAMPEPASTTPTRQA
jgi:MFS family permease